MIDRDDLAVVLAEQVRRHEESGCEDKERGGPYHDFHSSLSVLALWTGKRNATGEAREIARLALVISTLVALVQICSVVVNQRRMRESWPHWAD